MALWSCCWCITWRPWSFFIMTALSATSPAEPTRIIRWLYLSATLDQWLLWHYIQWSHNCPQIIKYSKGHLGGNNWCRPCEQPAHRSCPWEEMPAPSCYFFIWLWTQACLTLYVCTETTELLNLGSFTQNHLSWRNTDERVSKLGHALCVHGKRLYRKHSHGFVHGLGEAFREVTEVWWKKHLSGYGCGKTSPLPGTMGRSPCRWVERINMIFTP